MVAVQQAVDTADIDESTEVAAPKLNARKAGGPAGGASRAKRHR